MVTRSPTRSENTSEVEKVYPSTSSMDSSPTSEELEMKQKQSGNVEIRADGSVACTVCGKTAQGKRARDIIEFHTKSHLEGKSSFNCQDCGKQFKSKSSLKSHISRLINQLA